MGPLIPRAPLGVFRLDPGNSYFPFFVLVFFSLSLDLIVNFVNFNSLLLPVPLTILSSYVFYICPLVMYTFPYINFELLFFVSPPPPRPRRRRCIPQTSPSLSPLAQAIRLFASFTIQVIAIFHFHVFCSDVFSLV